MKKIFSIFASSVLALSMFVSCSGDLHNDMDPAKVALIMGETKTILDEADLMGDFFTDTDWEPQLLTKVDSTTYTFSFAARKDKHNFAIRKVAGQWDIARWFGENKDDKDNPFSIEPGKSHIMTYYEGGTMGGDFGLSGLTVGTNYTLTIKIENEDKNEISASLAEGGEAPVTPAAPTPVPYVLSGIFMRGIIDPSWGCTVDACLNEFTTDKDGNVFYQKDFVASGIKSNFKLGSKDWSNGWAGTTFKVGEDYVEFAEKRVDGVAYMTDTGNKKGTGKEDTADAYVDGMTSGKNYRISIKTTPEKKVYAKVYEIAAYEIVFEVKNLEDVNYAWLNGGFFNGWATGWPFAEWGTLGDGFDKSDIPEVSAGKAVFGEKFKVTGVAKPGETISGEVKFTATADDWATVAYNKANISVDVKITGAGKYIVTIDASENEATVTKM